MIILYSNEFKKQFKKLPKEVQKLYFRQEKIFKESSYDKRLHLKKLIDHPFPFSFRITRGYRVLFLFVEENTAYFATIGHRKDIYN